MFKEVSRFAIFPAATVCGVPRPYPSELNPTVKHRAEVKRPCKSYALDTVELLESFDRLTSERPVKAGRIPKKASVLAFNVAFSDSHDLPLTLKVPFDDAVELATRVLRQGDEGQVVAVPEILKIALDISDDDMAKAAVNVAVTTRHFARAQDHRLLPIRMTPKTMDRWKKATADDIGIDNPDTAGDLYHFYAGLLSGLARVSHSKNPYNIVTGRINDMLCWNTANATQTLRYRLFRQGGEVHREADISGYEIGKAIRCKIIEK